MTTFFARIMDGETGNEGAYQFEGPANLMDLTADEIVGAFFEEVDRQVLHDHLDWELNAVMNNRQRHVVTAIGSLIPEKNEKNVPPIPFLLMISDRDDIKGPTS